MGRFAIAILLVVAAAGIAGAEAPSSNLTPDQYVALRQASYDMSGGTFGEMRLAAKAGGPITKQAFQAQAIAKWARVLPLLFPAGTGPGAVTVSTHARPEIWTDRAGFEKAASDYATAADKLADFARTGDTAGFTSQLEVLDKACDACHDKYKSK